MKYANFFIQERKIARVIWADTYFLRLRGLIGRKLAPREGLILCPCNQIHTFFMGYSIDAIYLDKEYQILRIDSAIPPNRVQKGEIKCRCILELPADTASALDLSVGDVLSYTKNN